MSRAEIATTCHRRGSGAASAQCQTDKSALAKLTHVGDQRHLIGERSPPRQGSPRASSRTPSRNHINLLQTPLGFQAAGSAKSRDFAFLRPRFWSDNPVEDTEALPRPALANDQASRRTLPLGCLPPAAGVSKLLVGRRAQRIWKPKWAKTPIRVAILGG